MPEAHHVRIDRARRAAKKAAREGGATHQQALDQAARDAGYAHWSDMVGVQPAVAPESPAPAPTLASVQAETVRLMSDPARRSGLRIGDWVSNIMREAARKALARPMGGYAHAIRQLDVDAQMLAQAADPNGGPWPAGSERVAVRCPLHDDRHPSLVIAGAGGGLGVRCMAGCDGAAVRDHVMSLVVEAAGRAVAFMKANDRSRVVSGSSLGPEGVGGMGGRYQLADGSVHEMPILAMRFVAEGYPVWFDRALPRRVDALDRAIRVMLAGRHPMTILAPDGEGNGVWRIEVDAGRRYRIAATTGRTGPIGVNSYFKASSTDAAEIHADARSAAARVLELVRRPETLDPEEMRVNKERYDREVARTAAVQGVDDEGWGWWAGPNEDEFTWGGPWKVRSEAISRGNGNCSEKGEVFYVIQARTVDEPDDMGMYEFLESRGLKRCRATD